MSNLDLTQLLEEVKAGRASVSEELLPLVYDELRILARSIMKGSWRNHTLEPTSLVNEACVKLLGASKLSVESRVHFFALAAMAMRQVLWAHAKAKRERLEAQNSDERITLSGVAGEVSTVDALALDDALTKLATLSPRQAKLVELRYFGGMTMDECSQFLDTSIPTLEREWRGARAFLRSELRGDAQQ
jgi:hypothetical protein